jgi:hypothetical protein
MEPFLASQLEQQGLPAPKWHLPVFCCDQLQSAAAMPMFLSRADLVEAWVLSGREEAEVRARLRGGKGGEAITREGKGPRDGILA